MKRNSFTLFGGITFLLSFIYFRLFAPQFMSFQIEQGLNFTFTKEYIFGQLWAFGGPAELFSNFIMKSYINPWLGALALAVFMVFIAFRIFTMSQERFSISVFLLAISTSYIMFSHGILTTIIALSMVIFTFEDQEEAQLPNWLWLFRGIAFPILLWGAGSWAWIYVITIFPWDIVKGRKITWVQGAFFLYSLLIGLIAYLLIWPISFGELFIKTLPVFSIEGIILLFAGLWSMFYAFIIKRETRSLKILYAVISSCILILSAILPHIG